MKIYLQVQTTNKENDMRKLIAVYMLLFCGVSNAAVTVVYDNTSGFGTSSLTGYSTTGAMMDGMTVQVNGGDTYIWGDIDNDSGWATDNNQDFYLRIDGNTFNSDAWSLHSSYGITSLFLDAGAGDSVFDVYNGGYMGTDGSASGKTFSTSYSGNITVTYSGIVSLDGQSAVGDLYRYMLIEFTGGAFTGQLSFSQDTDNLSISGDIEPVPLPAAVWLFGSGLVGLFGLSRRKRSAV